MKNHTAKSLGLGPLTNAVEGKTFSFALRKSNCSKSKASSSEGLKLSPHDLDSTNIVFGFKANEWNSEALYEALDPNARHVFLYPDLESGAKAEEPADIDMRLAFEMFGQAKVLLHSSLASTGVNYFPCNAMRRRKLGAGNIDLTDGMESEINNVDVSELSGEATSLDAAAASCQEAQTTLANVGYVLGDNRRVTVQNLMAVISDGLEQSIDRLDKTTTSITLSSYQINSQIKLETMLIDAAMEILDSEFFTVKDEGRRLYEYENWGSEFSGSSECLFIDLNSTTRVPRQIMLVPYQSNCSFVQDDLSYSSELRAYFPSKCIAERNSVMAFSTSTFITADEYGSDVTGYNSTRRSGTPYLVNPRRWLRLVLTKLTWQSIDLVENFGIDCLRSTGSCMGFSYRLPRTGRYVFTSDDALQTQRLIDNEVSIKSPLRLLQVIEPSLYIDQLKKQVVPELLDWLHMPEGVFEKTLWVENVLKGADCSMLIDSNIDFVTENQFYLDLTFSTVYRAAFAFIFSNGSVTDLKDTSAYADATSTAFVNLTEIMAFDTLDYVRLKGDEVQRTIRILVPRNSFKTTMIGCGLLMLLALIVVIVPSRRVEYFPHDVTMAEEFVAVSNDEKYPDLVHEKTFYFSHKGASLPFSDFTSIT